MDLNIKEKNPKTTKPRAKHMFYLLLSLLYCILRLHCNTSETFFLVMNMDRVYECTTATKGTISFKCLLS